MPSASDNLRERNLFQPIEDIDTDIPSFANYLPASHSAPSLPDTSAAILHSRITLSRPNLQ